MNEFTPWIDLANTLSNTHERVKAERNRLRAALVALVGANERLELLQMEAAIRAVPAQVEDKATLIDAIHALLATLPVQENGAKTEAA